MSKIELAPDALMRQRFTCTPKPIKGDPAGQLFSTKMGVFGTHHLFRDEAEALIVNIGAALGIDVQGACNAHDQLVDVTKRLLEDHKRMYPHHSHLCALCGDSAAALTAAGAV